MLFQEVRDWRPGSINVAPPGMIIMAKCGACGVEKLFDTGTLPAKYKHAYVSEIEMKLRCECGAKDAKLRFGYFVSEDDTWKTRRSSP